jgi:hypothetical protein
MATGDFGVDNKSDLKYAQAYTLVHFCLEGEGQRYRDRFFDFLRGVYLGKSSMSDFKEALGGKERELEKAWNVYVGRKP